MQKIENILVIHTAFLGDIVLTSGALRTIRKKYPSANIYFLTTPQGKDVLEPNPWNLNFIEYDKRGRDSGFQGFLSKKKEIQAIPFDLTFCFHRYFRSSLLARLSNAKKIIGFHEASGSFLYTKKIKRNNYQYEGERYLACVGEYTEQDVYPELFFSSSDEKVANELLAPLEGKQFLAIAPSAAWATKRWPVERFAAIARLAWEKYKIPSVAIGGNTLDDLKSTGLVVQYFVHGKAKQKEFTGIPLNLGGRTNLGSMKYILSKAKAFIGNDSAPLHIAIAMGIPVVGIYGPTTKELGFFPYAPPGKAEAAEIPLHCRPCGAHGHNYCPEAHFRCMLELPVEKVFHSLEQYLCQ